MDYFCAECGRLLVQPYAMRPEWTHRDGSPECDDSFPVPCPTMAPVALRDAA